MKEQEKPGEVGEQDGADRGVVLARVQPCLVPWGALEFTRYQGGPHSGSKGLTLIPLYQPDIGCEVPWGMGVAKPPTQ